MMALVLGGLLWVSVPQSGYEEIGGRIAALSPAASAARLTAIALVFAVWPWIVGRVVQGTGSSFESTQQLRWRVTAWLLIFELVLGQDLPGRLLT